MKPIVIFYGSFRVTPASSRPPQDPSRPPSIFYCKSISQCIRNSTHWRSFRLQNTNNPTEIPIVISVGFFHNGSVENSMEVLF